ncbi:alpha-L-fucosidase 2 [Treponema bryantii]|uniref:Alpha-L-fucosidase 2 n=1 Tax=Treponema bryantii TaxID=163 RepID=A0A1H9JI68_9SPIR|nr:glycoside hydrolase family 95 protein [Treponema bryantii]SEQ86473.1 alpha-L-fucosidase 2 [Treponema bryantii]
MNSKLLFNVPPQKWEEYLPLGNGRLGCMVKAHPCNEVLQLNEEGIWSGGPQNRLNTDTKKNLEKLRSLVNEGRVLEAQSLGFEAMSGTSFNQRAYQTAGDFHIDFFSQKNNGLTCGWPLQHKADEKVYDNYRSELFLDMACSLVTYTDDEGIIFTRRTWISAVDDMLFMHVTASKQGKINYSGYLDRGIWTDRIYAENNCMYIEDSHGIPFCGGVGAIARGGEYGTRGACLYGEACDEVLFFIDIQSLRWNKKWNDKPLSPEKYKKLIQKNVWSKECKKNLEEIKNRINEVGLETAAEDFFAWHLVEWKNYWDRCEVEIGESNNGDFDKAGTCSSTPELLKAAAPSNTTLVNQYINFSRYLMISGSRTPGVLPLTLQGLWNGQIEPPWQSKYTININAQMNYWPVNMTNLSECELPYFDLLERCYENGRIAAQKMYGCRGYVLHHNTDYWGDAAPQDAWLPATYWVLGAAWLATHIIEHFEYTQDKAFLARYYYLMHEAALFFVDYLVLDGDYLIINPSLSPENSYVTKTGETGAFTAGCEMDNMILEHLFKGIKKARDVLGDKCTDKKGHSYSDEDFSSFDYVLLHLKKPSLNSDGSLMEWNREVEEVEPGHRHISHLYGLYPGHTITVEKTPELAEACKKTLKKRLENGGGHTGWSQSWIINFRAQLEQGDEALEALTKLLTHSTLPNLLDNHPPFQIDGNFSSLAAVIRMLVQSEFDDHGNVIVKLLPALPGEPAWQTGHVRGVAIKGGYTLDFEWKNGKIVKSYLHKGKNSLNEDKIIIA